MAERASEQGMPSPTLDARDRARVAGLAVALLVVVPTAAWLSGGLAAWKGAGWTPRLDMQAFWRAPIVTQAHVVAILTLALAGWGILALRKGDRRHRTLGRIWVSAMSLMGIGALAIPHGRSVVPAYVGGGLALALMAHAYWSIRHGRVRAHARSMAILMVSLVFMAAIALAPGRLMHDVLFGQAQASAVGPR